ncbi:MAG: hypothetical protein FJZ96_12450, partial [Chloroflexi bacterium]|nr:hypothetical protein [Chloroflexota bacterium]
MTLPYILVSVPVAVLVGLLSRSGARVLILLGISALAVFALQPALPVRGLDYWLPLCTLALAVLSWFVTASSSTRGLRTNWQPLLVLGVVAISLGLTRYLSIDLPLPVSRPPQIHQIAFVLAGLSVFGLLLARLPGWKCILWMALLLLLFILLKSPELSTWFSGLMRSWNDQAVELAAATDLRWLGFSYIAFRSIHTIRERQSGRLPDVSLAEYVTYIVFFPALTAGPIDRLERFIQDLRKTDSISRQDAFEAGRRLALGLFKKFVVADSLALVALNEANALQVQQAGWMWFILYAYSFQIFFDFSGYTDIAIGLGRLAGIRLPENFSAPYLKPNITQFWNNWHMTLTQWFRAYFFNPVTRSLRSRKWPIPLIILITQFGTMLLIGLWHGISWNFIFWGLWHGLGLFIHNRWSEWTK